MAETVVIKPAIAEEFARCMRHGRILFFGAPCGFGKTTLANALIGKRAALRLSAQDEKFAIPDASGDWDILLLDDLQGLRDEDWQALCALIRAAPERRFLLLSRAAPPGCLMAFQYAGLMTVFDADALLFSHAEVRKLFSTMKIPLTESELTAIFEKTIGYPLGVAITARGMAAGKPFDQALVAQGMREVFLYFESVIYLRFDLPVRRFLLELAPFERFDLELVRMVSGDPHAGAMLDWLQRNTSMLRYDGVGQFHFWAQFRDFLLWEMDREYTDEKRRALLCRAGLYYELKEDYPRALDCYTRGGDHSKVSELLIRNAELHPGMGHYSEMASYYRALPEAEVLASPALMQGMSMLCALSADYAGSERWYQALADYAERGGRQDGASRQARSRLAWLDISLPQRGVNSLVETIPAVFRLLRGREIKLPPFSVTSALPSIMNGGKDFSEWSRRDDFFYATLRVPVEAVMQRDGVGLADCAIAESKFEKGEDISQRMLALIPRMSEIQCNGTQDMEFAVCGLFARSQLANGQVDDARRTIGTLRARFSERSALRFLPNIDAMLCRFDLQAGNLDAANAWYREHAPRDPIQLHVMKRYQYLTQAMVELADGRPADARVTLAPLRP